MSGVVRAATLGALLVSACTQYATVVVEADGGAEKGVRLDPSFGDRGVFRLDIAVADDQAVGLVLRKNGGVLALSAADCALVALTPAGGLDVSFTPGGIARETDCRAVGLRVDEKRQRILVAASASYSFTKIISGLLTGGRDLTFGSGSGVSVIKLVTVQAFDSAPDGRIFVAGTVPGEKDKADAADLSYVQLLPSGDIEPGANLGSPVIAGSTEIEDPTAVVAEASGGATVWGTLQPANGQSETSSLMRAHFDDKGRLDSAGLVRVPGPMKLTMTAGAVHVAVEAGNGDTLLAGHGVTDPVGDKLNSRTAWFSRMKGDKPDPAFANQGFGLLPGGSARSELSVLLVQSDGGFFAAGTRAAKNGTDSAFVARFDAQGNADMKFGVDGMFQLPLADIAAVHSLAATKAGLLVGGWVGSANRQMFVARLIVP